MPRSVTRLIAAFTTVTALLALGAASAPAASTFYIQGAGYGHGIGLSQYGTYGYAKRGRSYDFIVRHYYRGVEIETLPKSREVRVLLQSNLGSASFSGATKINGRTASPGTTYSASRVGSTGVRVSGGGQSFTVAAPARATGRAPLRLRGASAGGSNATYRGALEFRPGRFGGINSVNSLNSDDYVKGVIPAESPASWPLEALKAQAVVARAYGIASSVGGNGFDLYPDTRSQVYRGVNGEHPRANQAAEETAGEIVTYDGKPATTYFFSTSGGRTENIENSFIGAEPQPWLKSVSDPFDHESPRHRWTKRYSLGGAGGAFGGWVKGSFRTVRVVKRGSSPRVVHADVIGTRGRTRVTGPQIRARLGLDDTWMYFTVMSSSARPRPIPAPTTPAEEVDASENSPNPGSTGTGGTQPRAATAKFAPGGVISGAISPVRAGARALLQHRSGKRWETVRAIRLGRGGRYSQVVAVRGTYRIRYGKLVGPSVRVR